MRTRQGPLLTARVSEALSGYAFLLPYGAFFVLFVVYPVLKGFTLSLQDYSVIDNTGTWVGLQNYSDVVQDKTFWKSLGNTAYFTALSTPLLVAIGLTLALAVNRNFKFSGLFRVLFFSPYVLSISVVATLWLWMLGPKYGLIAKTLTSLGFTPPNFLFNPTYAMPAIVLTTVWWTVGFNMTIFLAGLQDIPEQLYEAAAIDGANARQRFWHVTVPGLSRTTLFVSVHQVIASFQIFGQVFIMTQGGPYGSTRVVIQYIYENAFKYFKMGHASAMAYVVFLIILVLSLIQFRLNRSKEAD